VRPNYFVFATEEGRPVIHGLYYNGGKANQAFEKLRVRNPDGSYTILYEDARSESIYGVSGELSVKSGFLGDHIWTNHSPWKKSFFDTSEEEFQELANFHRIPIGILKEIAGYEKDYIENRGDTRWSAWKRAYLPRFLYNWV